jgi:mono/diheme cytochrome c family protein
LSHWRASFFTAGVLLVIAAGTSAGQGRNGNARLGHELALRLCANCHVVDSLASGPVPVGVPSFATIAARAESAEQIAGRIIVPHPPMPDATLSAPEIRDIVAYIMSLRRAK